MKTIEDIIKKYKEINDEEKKALDYNKRHEDIYYTEVEKVIEAKPLIGEGMIKTRKHPRFCAIIPHSHNYLEINYVLSGEIKEVIDGSEVDLKKGDLVFFSKQSKHTIKPAKEDDILINFFILPEFFDFIIPYIDKNGAIKNFLINLLSSDSETNSIIFRVSSDEKIQNIIYNILFSFDENDRELNDILRYYFMILIFELTKRSGNIETTASASFDSVLLFKTYSYIENNYVSGSLIEFSTLLNEDYNYISKRIKKLTGFSFQELLENKRIEVSKTLLVSTDININDIAIHIGYNNLTFFYSLFKKHEGMTPLKYRNMNKQ